MATNPQEHELPFDNVVPISGYRNEDADEPPSDDHLWDVPIEGSLTPPDKTPGKSIDWPDLEGKSPPARQWAIHGWLGFGHVTMLFGPGGVGKSLLAQHIASYLAISEKRDDFIDELSGPQKIVTWACEDDHDEIWRRQIPIASALKKSLTDFEQNLFIYPRQGLDNILFTQHMGNPLFVAARLEELKQQVFDHHASVVMLDNVNQMFGANANDSHHVTTFINGLCGALPGCAILLLAHPSRAAGSEFAGSAAWENASRNRWFFGNNLPDAKPDETEQDSNVRFLARRKSNYSAKDYRRFTYQDGALVMDAPEPDSALFSHLRDKKAERVLIDGARILKARDIRFTEGVASPDYLPKKILAYKLANGCNKTELAEAMRAMLLDGRLTKGIVGRYQNRAGKEGLIVSENA